MKLSIRFLVIFFLGVACNPPVPVTPPLDAGDAGPADTCMLACQNLAGLQCEEATPNCVATCRHARDAGLVPLDARCAATAPTKDAARACAGIRCP